eukprot:748971-Hanusia_phi.AAC.1
MSHPHPARTIRISPDIVWTHSDSKPTLHSTIEHDKRKHSKTQSIEREKTTGTTSNQEQEQSRTSISQSLLWSAITSARRKKALESGTK